MASDSHEIKITSDLQETVTHKVEGPPDLDAAIRSHLNALQGEGNIPGAPGSAANEALDTSQVSSADAFGPGGQFGSGDKGDEKSQPDLAKPTSLYSSVIKQGAAQAESAPAITQPGAPTPAGNQAGGLVGALHSAVNGTAKTFQVLSNIAGGLIGKFLGVAASAGLYAAAVTGFIGALTIAEQFLDSLFQSLASNWEGLSPRVAMAQGVSEMELTAKKLRTEGQVGEDISAVTLARTDLQSTFISLSASVINTIAPTLEAMMEILSAALEVVNLLLKAFNYVTSYIQYGIKVIAQIAHLIGLAISNERPEIEPNEFSWNNVFGPKVFFDQDLFRKQGLEKRPGEKGYKQSQFSPQDTPPFDINL